MNLVTMCAACARKVNAVLHGGPAGIYCEACETIMEATKLATYRVEADEEARDTDEQ